MEKEFVGTGIWIMKVDLIARHGYVAYDGVNTHFVSACEQTSLIPTKWASARAEAIQVAKFRRDGKLL